MIKGSILIDKISYIIELMNIIKENKLITNISSVINKHNKIFNQIINI